MNAPFNSLSLVQRLEREGLTRGVAEAIAGGIDDSRSDLVTNATLRAELEVLRAETKAEFGILGAEFEILRSEFGGLRIEFGSLKSDFGSLKSEFNSVRGEFNSLRNEFVSFKEEIRLNIELIQNRIVIRLGAISVGLVTLMTAILGTLIALK